MAWHEAGVPDNPAAWIMAAAKNQAIDAIRDTNVLVYALFPEAPQYAAARALLDRAEKQDAGLCVSLTVVSEFLSIVTDSRRVTTPRSSEDAAQAIDSMRVWVASSMTIFLSTARPRSHPSPRRW